MLLALLNGAVLADYTIIFYLIWKGSFLTSWPFYFLDPVTVVQGSLDFQPIFLHQKGHRTRHCYRAF